MMTHREPKSPPTMGFRDSLRFRLSLSLALTIFLTMMGGSLTLSYFSYQRDIQMQMEALEAAAKIFAAPIADELSNDNKRAVQRILTGIGKFPQFKLGMVYTADGKLFAQVGFGATLALDEGHFRDNNRLGGLGLIFRDDLWVSAAIQKSGRVIGEIRLLSDISGIRKELISTLVFILFVSLGSALLTTLMSMRAVSVITQPITALSTLMQKSVSGAGYYEKAPQGGRGEITILSQSFNEMIEGIETRNRQLLDYQRTLEDKVDERTRALKLAKDEAETANAAKSKFLATMSHEIRTPMNGMLVMAELLATSNLESKHQRYADVIMKSGTSLLSIINDVLDFSKIESGNLELEQIPVNLRILAEDAMTLF